MNRRPFASVVVSLVLAHAGVAADARSSDSSDNIRINLDEPNATRPKSPPAQPKQPPAAPAAKADAKAAPSKPKPAKKADEPGKVDGLEVARGDRGFLGIKVENNTFKMTFYDRERKPATIDVSAAVLRWPVNYQKNDERTTLTPAADGKSLASEKVVRAPFTFKLYITLLPQAAAENQTVETYTVDFQQ